MPYEPVMPEGHHLGLSRVFQDAFSGNGYDATNGLSGPVAWRWVPETDAESLVSGASEVQPGTALKVAVGVAAGVLIGIAATLAAKKATPHIKAKWAGRKSRRDRASLTDSADSEFIGVGLDTLEPRTLKEFSDEVQAAVQAREPAISSAEASKRLLALLMAAAFIADQMRALSRARISDEASLELETAMRTLQTPQVTDTINRMLQASGPVLDEETSEEMMKLFGGGKVVDGQYVPVQNASIKDALRLTDGNA